VRVFGVVPEFRGQGIEEKLAETALEELKNRDMKVAQSWVDSDQEDIVRLWESLGFKLVRRSSLMTRNLVGLQSDIGENMEVVLKPLHRDADEIWRCSIGLKMSASRNTSTGDLALLIGRFISCEKTHFSKCKNGSSPS
jgi:hypothetical protein